MIESLFADYVWEAEVLRLAEEGRIVRPRGRETFELLNSQVTISMLWPIVSNKFRNASLPFMFGEAAWILSGSDKLEEIAEFAPSMAKFSDDGVKLAGAYGPKIDEQIDYVIDALANDISTRQAVMTIWRQNPRPSKDIPCTVCSQFFIREPAGSLPGEHLELHQTVYMRSSDIWLGLPYDLFTFSMLGMAVCSELNMRFGSFTIEPGTLTNIAASRHAYIPIADEPRGPEHFNLAEFAHKTEEEIEAGHWRWEETFETPYFLYDGSRSMAEISDYLWRIARALKVCENKHWMPNDWKVSE